MVTPRKRIIIFLAYWIFICALFGSLKAQSNDSAAATRECLGRQKEIENEMSGPKVVAWMGEYNKNMSIFALAPTAGFFLFRGSDYLYSSCAWGRVELSDGKIKLIPDPKMPTKDARGLDLEWLPVTWGDRHYLVATSDLLNFVNAVNNGYEPSYGFLAGVGASFYKLSGDADRKVAGFPDVPSPFRDYLLTKPIWAQIVAVGPFEIKTEDSGKSEIRVTKVTVDVGAKQGVKVGMIFLTYAPRLVHEDIEITRVYGKTSDGVIRQSDTIYDLPSTKWKVSTSTRDIK